MKDNVVIKPSIIFRFSLYIISTFFLYPLYLIITDARFNLFSLCLFIIIELLFIICIILSNVSYRIINNELIIKYPFLKEHVYKLDEIIGFITHQYTFRFYTSQNKFDIISIGNKVKKLFYEILKNNEQIIIANGEAFLKNNKEVAGGLFKKTKILVDGIYYKNKLFKWNELTIIKKYYQDNNLFFIIKSKINNVKIPIHKDMFNGMIGILVYIEKRIENPN